MVLYEILLSQNQVSSWFSKCKIKANDLSIASPNQEHHTQLEVWFRGVFLWDSFKKLEHIADLEDICMALDFGSEAVFYEASKNRCNHSRWL